MYNSLIQHVKNQQLNEGHMLLTVTLQSDHVFKKVVLFVLQVKSYTYDSMQAEFKIEEDKESQHVF